MGKIPANREQAKPSVEGKGPAKAGGRPRKYDPEATRANILAVAMEEFAENGLSGARIDEIAAKTRTSKRMIYYYFGDKQGLYRHVLEAAYQRVRLGEEALELDHLPPAEALRRLVEFTFTHHSKTPEFIRLVMIENIHHGAYLRESEVIRTLNAGVIAHIGRVYAAGCEAGVFRAGLEPIEIHWLISALAFFNVSNRATFAQIFDWDRLQEDGQGALMAQVVDIVLRFVLEPSAVQASCDEAHLSETV
ncbi:TetR/AcrR family transcriptional regulator [Breoghania sp.]|uniref:TetR/AcrR family transcriptional regulator n=1 Tax=Breoghania sp. TaxID=2065378 RepID=UPI002AA746B6|nr:TetR/AcrR family transcriptional regulator [Breoghania sp.]